MNSPDGESLNWAGEKSQVGARWMAGNRATEPSPFRSVSSKMTVSRQALELPRSDLIFRCLMPISGWQTFSKKSFGMGLTIQYKIAQYKIDAHGHFRPDALHTSHFDK